MLAEKPIPRINTLVDTYNLVSIKTSIPLAAFDEDTITGNLVARYSKPGEEFTGISTKKPIRLRGREIVVADEEKIIAIHPHRDSDQTKVRDSTRNVLLMICGVPNINPELLDRAEETVIEYITRFCRWRKTI